MNISRVLNYFQNNGINTQNYTQNNEFLGVWTSPKDIYENIAEYIKNAKYEVNLTFYNWYTDTDPARVLCNALQVAISNFITTPEYPKFVIRFMFSEQIVQKGYILKELNKAIQLYNLETPNTCIYICVKNYYSLGSYHFKYITIDCKYSLVTGANVQNRFNFNGDNWSDIGIILYGEITTLINKHFTELTGFQIPKYTFNFEGIPMLLLTNEANGYISNNYKDLYKYYSQSLNIAVVLTILWTQDELILISPNFDDPLIFYSIVDKISSNDKINIKILTSYNFNHFVQEHFYSGTNSKLLYELIYFNTFTHTAYLKGRLQIKWYSVDSVTVINGRSKLANHAKAIFADSDISIIGSYNLTTQSTIHSGELSVLIQNYNIANYIKTKVFYKNWESAIPFLIL